MRLETKEMEEIVRLEMEKRFKNKKKVLRRELR